MSFLTDNHVHCNEILYYQTSRGVLPYDQWLEKLDFNSQDRVLRRLTQVKKGGVGDYRSLGKGLYEFRLHFGSGLRVYFSFIGPKKILVLSGGGKSNQERDISRARAYLADYEERI